MNEATWSDLRAFLAHRLPEICAQQRPSENDPGHALPEASLGALRQIIADLDIERVFEFGSGRSTKLFLECGCELTSLEDSKEWLEQTLGTLSNEERRRFRPVHQPLQTVWQGWDPFKGWQLDDELIQALREAELVLIDSPAFPPFREQPLLLSLENVEQGLVVLDDANIPTVKRFCARLAKDNGLRSFHSGLDRGLFFFLPEKIQQPLAAKRGVWESLKAKRRFFMGRR